MKEENIIDSLKSREDIPIDFDWKVFLELNPQIAQTKKLKTELDVLRFWIRGGKNLDLVYKRQTVYREKTSKDPKILCFYLPAYYPFKENNIFWGDGFTEWTNINSWTPFYDGHKIASSTENNFQYDLRDKKVRAEHAKKAKKAGVHGFVFYHYWFSNHPGSVVMNEVLDKMLEDGEPDMPFCLEWANESWTRRWDGLENEYLIKQEYGNEKDHKKHFQYLNKFFSHKHYIKVNDMPVLCIYRIGHITNFLALKQSYNQIAQENGYPGIYFVELLNHFKDNGVRFHKEADAYAEYHPMYINSINSFETIKENDNFAIYDGNEKYKKITEIKIPTNEIKGKPYYRGFYTGWDNSPRCREKKADVDLNNHLFFSNYLEKQVENVLSDRENPENFLFLFAWNEFGEGAVLEGTNLDGGIFLQEVSNITKKFNSIFDFETIRKKHKKKAAIFLHVYYTEVLDSMLDTIKIHSSQVDLYVNFVEETYKVADENKVLKVFPFAKILISKNRGRDWGGFFRISKIINHEDYDVIFLAHGKRSFRDNRPLGDSDRDKLFENLFSTSENLKNYINSIRNGSGICASLSHKITEKRVEEKNNAKHMKKLSLRHGYAPPQDLDFTWGSIFAIHSAILKKMFVDVSLDDFELYESSDGLLPHALERFGFYLCSQEKLKVDYL